MILRFLLLILLDIIFTITLFEQQLILAVLLALTFILYTIELAVEMEFDYVQLSMMDY